MLRGKLPSLKDKLYVDQVIDRVVEESKVDEEVEKKKIKKGKE